METYTSDHLEQFFYDIKIERKRQELKWKSRRNSALKWTAILMEEVGELANALLDGERKSTYYELIQVAAVSCAWAEQILDGSGADEIKP